MPYVNSTQRPYVTAYLKADDIPTEFVIGDCNEYNSEKANYVNQPLKENTSSCDILKARLVKINIFMKRIISY